MWLLEFFEYELDAGVLENIEKGVVELLDEKGIYYIVEEDSEINLEWQEWDIQKEIQNIPETPEIKDNSILYITLSLVIVIALFGFILLFRKPKKSV
jgi:hypothetical protein